MVPNCFHILFCVQSHEHVSMRLHNNFSTWLDKWRARNVSGSQEAACIEWLQGHSEGQRPCTTLVHDNNDISRPPYYRYRRYRVHFPADDGEGIQES